MVVRDLGNVIEQRPTLACMKPAPIVRFERATGCRDRSVYRRFVCVRNGRPDAPIVWVSNLDTPVVFGRSELTIDEQVVVVNVFSMGFFSIVLFGLLLCVLGDQRRPRYLPAVGFRERLVDLTESELRIDKIGVRVLLAVSVEKRERAMEIPRVVPDSRSDDDVFTGKHSGVEFSLVAWTDVTHFEIAPAVAEQPDPLGKGVGYVRDLDTDIRTESVGQLADARFAFPGCFVLTNASRFVPAQRDTRARRFVTMTYVIYRHSSAI